MGNIISIRQWRPAGEQALLHSHSAAWPEGSNQQQVTGYPFAGDPNNLWLVKPAKRVWTHSESQDTEQITAQGDDTGIVKYGDRVRLQHLGTGRHLHSHLVSPPLSDKDHQWEVSAYGDGGDAHSDVNDNWVVQASDREGRPVRGLKGTPLKPYAPLRLVHRQTRCYLNCVNKRLPEFAFGQSEVTCGRDTALKNSVWYLASNTRAPEEDAVAASVEAPKRSLWGAVKELKRLHALLQEQTLQAAPSKHPSATPPHYWPLMLRPVLMWHNAEFRVVFVANPIVWLAGLFGVLLGLGLRVREKAKAALSTDHHLHLHRVSESKKSSTSQLLFPQGLLVAWAGELLAHTLWTPKELGFAFLYLPGMLTSLLVLGFGLGRLQNQIVGGGGARKLLLNGALVVLVGSAASFYWRLAPFTFGTIPMPAEQCHHLAQSISKLCYFASPRLIGRLFGCGTK